MTNEPPEVLGSAKSGDPPGLDGPVLVAMGLGDDADEAVRQGDALSHQAGVPLVICHVLPETVGLRGLLPQLHSDEATLQVEARALAAVVARIATITGRPRETWQLRLETGPSMRGSSKLRMQSAQG